MRQALTAMGFTTATPIQGQAIPHLLEGKDIIGQAQTGTGKTAAFAIPLIERIQRKQHGVQAIVICPTRELTLQVAETFRQLTQFQPEILTLCVFGGQPIDKQIKNLKRNPQIVVGTPGRMKDLIHRGNLKVNAVSMVVLDEADEMLNMGFLPDIEWILGRTPELRQTALFSATMPFSILTLAKRFQKNAVQVKVTLEDQPPVKIDQRYYEVDKAEKMSALKRLMSHHQFERLIIFCNTKWKVDGMVRKLQKAGFPAEGLHGGKTQNQRTRTMQNFRKGVLSILVATDVAARGLDVEQVEAVINYDLPKDTAFYTHRIGRTGRAGQSGLAFSLVDSEQLPLLDEILEHVDSPLVLQELPA